MNHLDKGMTDHAVSCVVGHAADHLRLGSPIPEAALNGLAGCALQSFCQSLLFRLIVLQESKQSKSCRSNLQSILHRPDISAQREAPSAQRKPLDKTRVLGQNLQEQLLSNSVGRQKVTKASSRLGPLNKSGRPLEPAATSQPSQKPTKDAKRTAIQDNPLKVLEKQSRSNLEIATKSKIKKATLAGTQAHRQSLRSRSSKLKQYQQTRQPALISFLP